MTLQTGLVRLHKDLLRAYDWFLLRSSMFLAALISCIVVVLNCSKCHRAGLVEILLLTLRHEHRVETQEGRPCPTPVGIG